MNTILITGCSSGIGYDTAKQLHEKGWRVFASCRRTEDVARLQSEGLADTLLLDVTDSAQIEATFAHILAQTGGRLDALFCNAGYGQVGAVEDIPRIALHQQFNTNVFGTWECITHAMKIFRRQGRGRVLVNSSILGFAAMPWRGAYNSSKFALEGLADTLRHETHGSAIFVSLIEPGPIATRFRPNALEKFKQVNLMSLPVVSDLDRLVGTLALYDVVEWFKRAADPKASWENHVYQIMNHQVVTAQPQQPIQDLVPYFVERSFNYIPVVEKQRLTGIISRADMIAALNQPHVSALYALKLDLVSGMSRLHSGLGELVLGGEVYYGVGALGAVSPQKEQISTSPTKLSVTLTGLDNSLLAEVMRERIVDRMAWLYLVVIGPAEVPLKACLQFKGRIAQTPVKAGKTNTIQLSVSNIFESWKQGLPYRCTDESHQRLYPGDRFFRYQDQMANREIHWGSAKDAPSFRYEG